MIEIETRMTKEGFEVKRVLFYKDIELFLGKGDFE